MAKVEPNPFSPYADAAPDVRHLFQSPIFFPDPVPGALALTGCERMAVVPEPLPDTAAVTELPEGLCPACLSVMHGNDWPDWGSPTECDSCGTATQHGLMCALCRQEMHEQWWPTRNDAASAVADV